MILDKSKFKIITRVNFHLEKIGCPKYEQYGNVSSMSGQPESETLEVISVETDTFTKISKLTED